MAEASIALTLVLDALGAKEEASSLAKTVDGFAESFKRMGAQMENTMRGRLIKGVIGSFRKNFRTLMNDELPAIVRQSKLSVDLAGAIAGVISPQAGRFARELAEISGGKQLQQVQGAFGAFQQLTQGGLIPISQEQANALVPQFINNIAAQQVAGVAQREMFDAALKQGLPSFKVPIIDVKVVTRLVFKQALPLAGEAVSDLLSGTVKGLANIVSAGQEGGG